MSGGARRRVARGGDGPPGILDGLKRAFGAGVGRIADNLVGSVPYWIPVAAPIDGICGGGFPGGRITTIGGRSWTGKTLVLAHAIVGCQRAGGSAVLINSELAFDVARCEESLGLAKDRLIIVPDPDSLREEDVTVSIERGFRIVRHLCEVRIKSGDETPFLVGWDSLSASPVEEVDQDGAGEQAYGTRAKVIKRMVKEANPFVKRSKTALVLCSQVHARMGILFGRREQMDGGLAVEFFSDLILELRRGKAVYRRRGSREEAIGADGCEAMVTKSKVGKPYGRAQFDIRFDRGILPD